MRTLREQVDAIPLWRAGLYLGVLTVELAVFAAVWFGAR